MKQKLQFCSFIMVLLFVCAPAIGQDSALLSGAKAERQVVLYGSGNLEMIQAVTAGFEKRYPFLKVPITRSSGERLVNRIRAEKLAGKILFDVVFGATVPFLPTFDVLQPYSSAEAGAYPAKFKDPGRLWSGVSANYYVIGYNTNLVAKESAPKDWRDLLDPKWKGRIGMDPEEFSWLGAMEDFLEREKAKQLMAKLANQNLQWRKGHSNIAQLLLAGEFAVALVYAHTMEEMKAKGAPVEWVRTTKPIVVDTQAIALSAKPAHPNGAKLLYDYFLTEEAQKLIFESGKVPIRPGAVPENSALHPSGLELHPTPAKVQSNLKQYAKEFEDIFNPR